MLAGAPSASRLSREERQQRVCAISLAAAGLVLLSTGAVFTATSHYRQLRGADLARYDAVINAWNAVHSAEFNATRWVLLLDGRELELMAGPGAAAEEADADAAASDDPLATQPYASERYALPGALWDQAPTAAAASSAASASAALDPGAVASEGAAAAAAAVAWAREPHTLSLAARRGDSALSASTPLPLLQGPLLNRAVLKGSGWKTCYLRHGGALQGESDCVVWSALAQLCVAVSRDADADAWRVDTRFGAGGGCDPWGSGGGQAPAAIYAHVPVPPAEGDDSAAAVPSWAAVRAEAPGRVEVRSAHDPALWAANATRGTMVFAQPAAERDAVGRVLLILGGLALLTAALLGVPSVVVAAAKRRGGTSPLDKRGRGDL